MRTAAGRLWTSACSAAAGSALCPVGWDMSAATAGSAPGRAVCGSAAAVLCPDVFADTSDTPGRSAPARPRARRCASAAAPPRLPRRAVERCGFTVRARRVALDPARGVEPVTRGAAGERLGPVEAGVVVRGAGARLPEVGRTGATGCLGGTWGAATGGTVTRGVDTDGVDTDGVVSDGVDTDGVDTAGVDTDGTVTDGRLTDGVVTDGTDTPGTVTLGTVRPGSVTAGTAGRSRAPRATAGSEPASSTPTATRPARIRPRADDAHCAGCLTSILSTTSRRCLSGGTSRSP